MYAYVVIKYRVPLERILQSIDRHRAYLGELHRLGKLLASGPLIPRDGGAMLLRVSDDAELQNLITSDPLHQEELVEPIIFRWNPGIGVAGLDSLAKPE